MRVVGLDLSLTASGIGRIWEGGVDVQVIGTKATDQSISARGRRLRWLASRVFHEVTAGGEVDLVLVEQPSYGSTGGHAHDRSGLWWLIMARLDASGSPVAEVAPGTLKTYALGKGSGAGVTKDAVLAAAVRRYVEYVPDLADNNAADALLLADMAASHFGRPLVPGLAQVHTRALAAIRWPSTPTTGA